MLTRSQTDGPDHVDDNQNDDFNADDWIIEDNKPQALNDLAVPLPTLELFEEEMNDQFCQLILAIKASDLKHRFL